MSNYTNQWDCLIDQWKTDCRNNVYKSVPPSPTTALTNPGGPFDGFKVVTDPRVAKNADLRYYEIPEPYYACLDAEKNIECDFVIISLNPGMNHPNEHIKFYQNLGKPRMTLINGLNARTYSEWQSRYNVINPSPAGLSDLANDGFPGPNNLPGYTWWNRSSSRINYAKRLAGICHIYGHGVNDKNRVFVSELCPFHSQRWNVGSITAWSPLPSAISLQFQGIQEALSYARINGGLPFAVAVGCGVSKALGSSSKPCLLKVELTNKSGKPSSTDPLINLKKWPGLTLRTYEVYNLGSPTSPFPILVTYAPGGNGNPAPKFCGIEGEIIQWMIRNRLI